MSDSDFIAWEAKGRRRGCGLLELASLVPRRMACIFACEVVAAPLQVQAHSSTCTSLASADRVLDGGERTASERRDGQESGCYCGGEWD